MTPIWIHNKWCNVSINDLFCFKQDLLSSATRPTNDILPTNDISVDFEIQPKFSVLWFKIYCIDHDKILHISRQYNCRDVCKIPLWTVNQILN